MIIENIKKYTPLNFELLSNPVNWAIVILMIATAGVALAFIFNMRDVGANEGN